MQLRSAIDPKVRLKLNHQNISKTNGPSLASAFVSSGPLPIASLSYTRHLDSRLRFAITVLHITIHGSTHGFKRLSFDDLLSVLVLLSFPSGTSSFPDRLLSSSLPLINSACFFRSFKSSLAASFLAMRFRAQGPVLLILS